MEWTDFENCTYRKKEIYSEDENVQNFQEIANVIKNWVYFENCKKEEKESYSGDENFERNEIDFPPPAP